MQSAVGLVLAAARWLAPQQYDSDWRVGLDGLAMAQAGITPRTKGTFEREVFCYALLGGALRCPYLEEQSSRPRRARVRDRGGELGSVGGNDVCRKGDVTKTVAPFRVDKRRDSEGRKGC